MYHLHYRCIIYLGARASPAQIRFLAALTGFSARLLFGLPAAGTRANMVETARSMSLLSLNAKTTSAT